MPAGYGWSFPAEDELRIGIGSFDPRFHVKDTTVLLTEDLGKAPNEYQGNWIPHKLRSATEGGVFFAGDSAGHCLPLTAEGIRTALYFGIVLGRELRAVVEGRQSSERAAERYAEFNDSHEWKFRWMLRTQRLLPRIPARLQRLIIRLCGRKRFVDWSFGHYLRIAPPDFAPPPRTTATAPASGMTTPIGRCGPSRTSSRPNRPRTADAARPPRHWRTLSSMPISGNREQEWREKRLRTDAYDALICGASFAGLAAARELAGSGARRPGARPLRDRRAHRPPPAGSRPTGCGRWA